MTVLSAVIAAKSDAAARRAAARGMRVRIPLTITECATRYRHISAKEGAQPGRYDIAKTPYLLGIHEALEETHPAEYVTFLKPTQIGGTMVGQNWICWTFLESPASMFVLLPSEKLGLRWVRSKFKTMVRATPALRRIIPSGTRKRVNDDDANTMTEVHAGAATMYLASANIGNDLRMVPARRLLLDEIDEYPKEIPGQGDPVEIAYERFKTFNGRRKAYQTSSPTDDDSRIAKTYADSSQGEFFVPCPHCGHRQTLEWDHLKYTPEAPDDAAYACDDCGELIAESHKLDMLRAGEWRHRKPELCDSHIGFRLNCLYTPPGLGDTWADNARKYEKAKKDPAKLRAFDNTRLAIVHRGKSVRLEAADLMLRRFGYRLRTIPKGVLLLTAGVDVQHDRVEVQIVGWGREERATVIDYLVIPGSPTGTEVWAALLQHLSTSIVNSFGVEMPIECVLIDSGNWQHEVTNFTRALRARLIFASKGSTIVSRPPIGRPTIVDVKYRGKTDPRGAEQYQIGVHVLKKTLFTRLQADGDFVARCQADGREWGPDDVSVRFPSDLGEEYFEQVTAEKYDAEKGRYVAIRERNEALDNFLLAMAAAMHHSIGMHRFRELEWQRREARFETAAAPKTAATELGKTAVPVRGGSFLPTSAKTTSDDS